MADDSSEDLVKATEKANHKYKGGNHDKGIEYQIEGRRGRPICGNG